MGCTGSGAFECNQCRTYKIKLSDLESVLLNRINSDLASKGEPSYQELDDLILMKYYQATQFSINKTEVVSFSDMIKYYMEYYPKKNLNHTQDKSLINFCVPECPSYFKFKTSDYFCTNDDTSR